MGSESAVAAALATYGLRPQWARSFAAARTTDSDSALRATSNRWLGRLAPTTRSQVWVGDITYLPRQAVTGSIWSLGSTAPRVKSVLVPLGWHVERAPGHVSSSREQSPTPHPARVLAPDQMDLSFITARPASIRPPDSKYLLTRDGARPSRSR